MVHTQLRCRAWPEQVDVTGSKRPAPPGVGPPVEVGRVDILLVQACQRRSKSRLLQGGGSKFGQLATMSANKLVNRSDTP